MEHDASSFALKAYVQTPQTQFAPVRADVHMPHREESCGFRKVHTSHAHSAAPSVVGELLSLRSLWAKVSRVDSFVPATSHPEQMKLPMAESPFPETAVSHELSVADRDQDGEVQEAGSMTSASGC
jgi:hypothetical protein